jgi:hypothetical protein
MQGFGQESLLTAAEEKTLARLVRTMLLMELKKEEAIERLQRGISEREWAAECNFSDLQSFRKALKVRRNSAVTVPGSPSANCPQRLHPAVCGLLFPVASPHNIGVPLWGRN